MKMTLEDLNNPEVMFPSAKKELDIGNRTAIDVLQDPPTLKPEHVCGAADFAYAAETRGAVCPACDLAENNYKLMCASRAEQHNPTSVAENPETAWVDENGNALPDIQVDPLFVAALQKEEENIRRHNEYVLLCHHGDVEPMGYQEWLEFDKKYQEHVRTAGSVLSPATFQKLSETVDEKEKSRTMLLEEHVRTVDAENKRLSKQRDDAIIRSCDLESELGSLRKTVENLDTENQRLEDENEELWEGFREYSNRSTPANFSLYPHYFRETPNTTHVDVNWFLEAWGVGHTVGHAVKKLMCLGQRGVKGKLQDLEEARNSINRAIELEQTK